MAANWKQIQYLLQGNQRQIRCYHLLKDTGLWEDLKPYNVVLVGTIPIEIDVPESDLDLICEVDNLTAFYQKIKKKYQGFAQFHMEQSLVQHQACLVINFSINQQAIEIFAQNQAVEKQMAYRHMICEHRVLQLLGEAFKLKIMEWRNCGFKTEEAFAACLALAGNPYQAVLKIENWSDQEIIARFPIENCLSPSNKI